MERWTSVVISDGVYKGWVGYFLEKDSPLTYLIRLFSSEGELYDVVISHEFVKNVCPLQDKES